MEIKEFKPCGDCHECCSGKLLGRQYGNEMSVSRKCVFLVSDCVIHKTRPESCKKYQCAWSQGLFSPEWMIPNKSGALISVERDIDGQQYLKVVHSSDLADEVLSQINEFCKLQKCEVVYVRL